MVQAQTEPNLASRPQPVVAIALALIHVGAVCAGVALAVLFAYLTGAIGICLGYYRLLTHRSLRLPRILEYAVATLGVLALQGGPITW